MALGIIKKAKRNFGNKTAPALSAGMPDPYNLDFGYPYLGVPFYHFMSNWETAGAKTNFIKKGTASTPAQVDDKVAAWSNTYLGIGEGTAFVPFDYNTGQGEGEPFFGDEAFPTLVEKDYDGKKLKGLRFTGLEYLQIDGATVTNVYSPPSPIFTTAGASWAGSTGATFMFVIDQEVDEQWSRGDTAKSNVQALFTSRQPVGIPAGWMLPQPPNYVNYTWPSTESFGVQYFRNSRTDIQQLGRQSWGPDAVLYGLGAFGYGTALDRPPLVAPHYGGANCVDPPSSWGFGQWKYGPGVSTANNLTNTGLQVILLEYDNTDHLKFISPDAPARSYEGPTFKLYATAQPGGLLHDPPRAWPDGDLSVPRLTGSFPTLRNHVLFDAQNAFLGGMPPAQPRQDVGAYANGFRGIIYEVLMLEGILSSSDKQRLLKILERKYPLK